MVLDWFLAYCIDTTLSRSVWPNWAIYRHLGNILKPAIIIFVPNCSNFLFPSENCFGNFLDIVLKHLITLVTIELVLLQLLCCCSCCAVAVVVWLQLLRALLTASRLSMLVDFELLCCNKKKKTRCRFLQILWNQFYFDTPDTHTIKSSSHSDCFKSNRRRSIPQFWTKDSELFFKYFDTVLTSLLFGSLYLYRKYFS